MPRPPKKKDRRPLALPLLASALFASIVLVVISRNAIPDRERVTEVLAPDFEKLLPAGARVQAEIELPDAPQFAHVVAYEMLGEPLMLSLVTWNREEGEYQLVSSAAFSGAKPESVTSLEMESLGAGAPVAIIARGPVADVATGAFLFARSGNALRPIAMSDENGTLKQAHFFEVSSGERREVFAFEDVDGDSDDDVVVAVIEGESLDETQVLEVYEWTGDRYSRSERLTEIVGRRNEVFPAPVTEPETPFEEIELVP